MELVGFIALHFISKSANSRGEIALLYVTWYGTGRARIEGLRTDSLYLGPMRVSQILAVISCAAAIVILVRKYNRIAGQQKILPAAGAVPAEACAGGATRRQ